MVLTLHGRIGGAYISAVELEVVSQLREAMNTTRWIFIHLNLKKDE